MNASEHIGYETLQRMASVSHYNRWIYESLAPFAGRRVLEVGCGIGNMTQYFLDSELLLALDPLPASVQAVQARYQAYPHVQTLLGDITDAQLMTSLLARHLDTILCINVLEHIADDTCALQHMAHILQPGGHLLLMVPAGPKLYGALDEALGHHRRYTRAGLAAQVQAAGLNIVQLHYMNLAGILGWWWNSRVRQRHLLPASQLRWFNHLTPWFIWLERHLQRLGPLPAGQSLICIAQKKT